MKIRTITQVALMTAILIILGLIPGIPVGFIPVPIVLQNLGVMLAGALLGSKKGTLAVFSLLVLVALGCPFLPGGRGGIAVFIGPSGGYLLSYLLCPLIMGKSLKLFSSRKMLVDFAIIWIVGVVFINVCGAIGLTVLTGMPLLKALLSVLVFIPGDTIKSVAAVLVFEKLRANAAFRSSI
ncbi:substrate-specific component [Liquorilactobacillus sucicola DSM 21376 = JCM 15457]|uniref:Biotin transporter n=1 Tax=Liquorilactobacillus sucicola DSM 21376 = JCM 15457 TaxID=1423806 RepID=A0A023CUZ0_9LACO|nr:biotin transporter BioY [Liquorilactobacillus sucicola]KRN05580.1 BioY protein [Liquorilactobacillus sucicola DSM 21376 = JCM 15457]GAJ25667.1 substrate-specific component [Liquorilactobacillus sucicola DSM 21376 = JCM 15457]